MLDILVHNPDDKRDKGVKGIAIIKVIPCFFFPPLPARFLWFNIIVNGASERLSCVFPRSSCPIDDLDGGARTFRASMSKIFKKRRRGKQQKKLLVIGRGCCVYKHGVCVCS